MTQPLFMAGELVEQEQTKEELYALLSEGVRRFREEGLSVFPFAGGYTEMERRTIVQADSIVMGDTVESGKTVMPK